MRVCVRFGNENIQQSYSWQCNNIFDLYEYYEHKYQQSRWLLRRSHALYQVFIAFKLSTICQPWFYSFYSFWAVSCMLCAVNLPVASTVVFFFLHSFLAILSNSLIAFVHAHDECFILVTELYGVDGGYDLRIRWLHMLTKIYLTLFDIFNFGEFKSI